MKIATRTALVAALAATLTAGAALPAQAAGHHAPLGTRAAAEARIDLPTPRLDPSVNRDTKLTAHVTQRASCAGTTKCVRFSGHAAPGEIVAVRYEPRPGAPRKGVVTSGPLTALLVAADARGDWSAAADFADAEVTTDAATGAKEVRYRVISSDDVLALHKTGQLLGSIPIR
jgi:hypothetical protein